MLFIRLKYLQNWFCYLMIALLVNVCVKADDDLYEDWNTNTGEAQTDASFNRMDHLVEFVVEICFGVDNYFPESQSSSSNHTDLHKIFNLYLAPSAKPVLVIQTSTLPMEQRNEFPDYVHYIGFNHQDYIFPPPKAS